MKTYIRGCKKKIFGVENLGGEVPEDLLLGLEDLSPGSRRDLLVLLKKEEGSRMPKGGAKSQPFFVLSKTRDFLPVKPPDSKNLGRRGRE